VRYTTKVQTEDGVVYDLGLFQHPPKHEHKFGCPSCLVKNAWTEEEEFDSLDLRPWRSLN